MFSILTVSGYSFVLRTRQHGTYCKDPIHISKTNNQRVRNFLIQEEKTICYGQGCFLYAEPALFNTFCFWSSEPRNNMLGSCTEKHFPVSPSTMFTSLIPLSVAHRRVLTTVSSVQVLGNGAARPDCPEDEESAWEKFIWLKELLVALISVCCQLTRVLLEMHLEQRTENLVPGSSQKSITY